MSSPLRSSAAPAGRSGVDVGGGDECPGDGRLLAGVEAGGLPRHPVAGVPRFALSALRGSPGWRRARRSNSCSTRSGDMRVRRHGDPDHHHRLQHGSRGIEYFGTRARPTSASATWSAWRSRCRCSSSPSPSTGTSTWMAASSRSGRPSQCSRTRALDHVIGVNLMLPRGFEPKDISGWPDGRAGYSRRAASCSRAITWRWHGAPGTAGRQAHPDRSVDDVRAARDLFYDLFLDRSHWPRLMRQGYEDARRALEGLR